VSRRFTLMEYTDDEAIPAVVLEQLVSQINQAVDAPVQDLFSRDTNPLVARVTRNGKSRMRAGCSTLEGRLTHHTPDTWTPLPCSINDIPLLFRIVGFGEGRRFQVHSARELGMLWTDVRVSAKDRQGTVQRWPAPVRLVVHPCNMVARGPLRDALATVAAGGELNPDLCMLRSDWQLTVDVDLSLLPDELSADVLLPHGHRVTARRAYQCLWCGEFGHRLERCSRCKEAHYCSETCQEQDWEDRHKRECREMRAWRLWAGN